MEKVCDLVKGINCGNCPFGIVVGAGADNECPKFRSSMVAVRFLTDLQNKSEFVIDQIVKGETEDR